MYYLPQKQPLVSCAVEAIPEVAYQLIGIETHQSTSKAHENSLVTFTVDKLKVKPFWSMNGSQLNNCEILCFLEAPLLTWTKKYPAHFRCVWNFTENVKLFHFFPLEPILARVVVISFKCP